MIEQEEKDGKKTKRFILKGKNVNNWNLPTNSAKKATRYTSKKPSLDSTNVVANVSRVTNTDDDYQGPFEGGDNNYNDYIGVG